MALLTIITYIITFLIGLRAYNLIDWKKWERILKGTSTINRYWRLVIIFLLTSCIIGYGVFVKSNKQTLYPNLNLFIQIDTLAFAICIGYFAFLQVMEGRFNDFDSKAMVFLRNQQQYKRAIKNWKKAHIIREEDFNVLSNLLEVYLFDRQLDEFDSMMPKLIKNSIEKSDRVICDYLQISRYLLVENMGGARVKLKELIKFTQLLPQTLNLDWDFNDMRKSDIYEKMNDSGEAKKTLKNLMAYLSKDLSRIQHEQFESGDYNF